MNTTRERLEQVLRDALGDPAWAVRPAALADRLLAAGVTLPEPAPLKVWPGTDALRDAHRLSSEARAVSQWFALTPEDYSAIAAAGWRALVASLPDASESGTGPAGWVHISGAYYTSRAALAALAALADPYDGGGKGVGQ